MSRATLSREAGSPQGLDTSALPAQEALSKFAAKEAAQAGPAWFGRGLYEGLHGFWYLVFCVR